jgi:hypothetical protein
MKISDELRRIKEDVKEDHEEPKLNVALTIGADDDD